jgi:AcrR family transcriptional regulator
LYDVPKEQEPIFDVVQRAIADADEVRLRAKEAKERLKAEVKEPAARAKASAKEVKDRLKADLKAEIKDQKPADLAGGRADRQARQRARQAEARRRAAERQKVHAQRHQERFEERQLWWTRPDRAAGRKGARDRAEVLSELIEAAVHIADLEGFDAISMRRLAQEVGMGTMSLYWYLEGKDDLLDLVLDHLMQDQILQPEEMADWRTGLRAMALKRREMLLAHPWLVQVMGQRPHTGPNVLRHIDQSLAVVEGLAVPPAVQMQILRVVDDWALGQVMSEIADAQEAREVGMTEGEWHEHMRPYYEAQVEEHDLGHLGRYLAEHTFDEEQVDSFEGGLEIVFAGIDALLARHRT